VTAPQVIPGSERHQNQVAERGQEGSDDQDWNRPQLQRRGDDRADLCSLGLRWTPAQQLPDLPRDHGGEHHPGGQTDDDAHAAGSNEPPDQNRHCDAHDRGEDGQPGIGTDHGLGLWLDGLETSFDDFVLPPRRQDQPEQSDRDSRCGEGKYEAHRGRLTG
jgi:hypothetical protein